MGAGLALPAGTVPRVVPSGVALSGVAGFLASEVSLEACTIETEAEAGVATPMAMRLKAMKYRQVFAACMYASRVALLRTEKPVPAFLAQSLIPLRYSSSTAEINARVLEPSDGKSSEMPEPTAAYGTGKDA
jgi:hypothetical protein